MDPFTIGGSLFGGGLGGDAGTAPSASDSVFSTNVGFDNSGWNVAFGNAGIDADVKKSTDQGSDLKGATSSNALSDYLPYAMLFIGALVAWKMLKK